jgi:hypothetical protein
MTKYNTNKDLSDIHFLNIFMKYKSLVSEVCKLFKQLLPIDMNCKPYTEILQQCKQPQWMDVLLSSSVLS